MAVRHQLDISSQWDAFDNRFGPVPYFPSALRLIHNQINDQD